MVSSQLVLICMVSSQLVLICMVSSQLVLICMVDIQLCACSVQEEYAMNIRKVILMMTRRAQPPYPGERHTQWVAGKMFHSWRTLLLASKDCIFLLCSHAAAAAAAASPTVLSAHASRSLQTHRLCPHARNGTLCWNGEASTTAGLSAFPLPTTPTHATRRRDDTHT